MNEHELRRLMFTAQQENMGPFVIRYPRSRGVLDDWQCPLEAVGVGKGRKLRDGSDVAVLSIGPIGNDVEKAIAGTSVAHYDMRFLKPLDENILHEVGRKFKRIVTIEDGVRNGGLGSAVLEWMSDHGYSPRITRMGLPDHFVEHGTVQELRKIVGLDLESIKSAISNE
jgi:1-deoxy-D-xylulose-5-phosphate synthase